MINKNVISYNNPNSIASESYRALRTNLQFTFSKDNEKVILVTSSHIGEGKSTVAANLATVFAMQDKKTVLVDCNLRNGVQHRNFGVSDDNGLSEYLNGKCDEKKLVKSCDVKNLYIINSGDVPSNPSELLSTDKMKKLIDNLKEQFDAIILDGAPVIPVTDSVVLSSMCDKVILVAAKGETKVDELKKSKNIIENAGATVAGVVFNKVDLNNKYYNKYSKDFYDSYYNYIDSEE